MLILKITTESKTVEMPVEKIYRRSEILKSQRTTFGKFAELKGEKIISVQYSVKLQAE